MGATRDVILSNTGTGTLTVSSIAAGTTNTRVGNTCGSGVAAGAFCTISITLLQPGSDVVTIMSNDPNGAQTISVTSLMADTASPSNLSFPDTLVASTNTQSFTLSNANNQTVVSFTGPNASDFSAPNPNASNISSSCNVTTQGVGSVCTIQVNFTPSGAGPRSAGMVVSSTGEYIPLSGNGLAVAPSSIATLTPASLSFTDLAQAQTVTLSNYASSPVGIQTITLPSEFSQTNNCGSSLPAQSACSIVVSSTRTFQGGTQGLLTVTGDFGSRTMQLGNHIDPILNFGNLMLSTSGSLSLTSPANLSGSPATYTGSLTGANSGDFTTSSCLNRSGTCSFTTTFSPKAIGIRSAILKASWSAPNNNGSFSQNYLVEGFGVSSPTPGLALSQSSLTSGPSSTTSVSITATNVGTTTLSLGSVAPVFTGANASEFSFSTNACTTLAPGATCSLSLLFTPAPGLNPGLQSANAVFTDVTSGQSFVFPLNVLVTPQPPTISSSVQFPSTQVNVISSPISVTVTAPQSHAVTASINAAYGNVNSSEFSLTKGSCAQGESPCVITLIFHPTVSAYADGGLTVTDNLSGLNTSVSIWGYGGIGVASAGPTSLSFPTRAVGTTSVAQTVSLSNTGGASFNISSIAVTGTNANEFALATSCGTSLAALGNCTIYVSFAPTSSGGKTASLIVSGDANAGLPIAVPITATAQ